MTVVARQPHSVHARRIISTDLTRLAELQAGVITTEQAVALGQSRHSLARLVQSGQWLRLTTGVYLTVPAAVDFAVLAGVASCWVAMAPASDRKPPASSIAFWTPLLRWSTC